MLKRVLYIIVVAILCAPPVAFGQLRHQKVNLAQALRPGKAKDIVSLLGLDPNKFSMSHSYSLTVGSGGYSSGLYLNTMQYRFSNPLTLYLQLGIQHHPFGNKFGNTTQQNQMFISGAGLRYKPSENFGLYLEYSNAPASAYYQQYPFRDPISRNRSWFDRDDEKSKE